MPRPTNKDQLISANQQEYKDLEGFLAPLTPEQMTQPGALGDWSVKDVLAHLYEWHQMVLKWYIAGVRGETVPIPAEGINWGQLPLLNKLIYEKYRDYALDEMLKLFRASHQEISALIQKLSEEELFTPGRYGWLKKNALASYLTSCTSSHYRWARTEMKKNLRQKKETK